MTDDPGKKASGGPKATDEEGENDRPTVAPPFDVEAFARASRGSPTSSVSAAACSRLRRS